MPSCAVFGCTNRSDRDRKRGVTFHVFPKDECLKKKWVHAIHRKDFIPSKSSVVCSEHFAEADIDRSSLQCVRLREGVTPSIFVTLKKDRKTRKPPTSRVNQDPSPLSIEALPSTPPYIATGRPAALYDTSNVDWAPSLKLGYDPDSTTKEISKTKVRKESSLPAKKGKKKNRKKLLDTPQGKDYSGISPLDFVYSQEEYNKFQLVLENSCKRKRPVTRVNFGQNNEESKSIPTFIKSASANMTKNEFIQVQTATDAQPRPQILNQLGVIEGDLRESVPQEKVKKQNSPVIPNGKCHYLVVLCVTREQERAIRKLFKAMCWPYRLKGTYAIVNYSENIDDMKLADDFLITINPSEDPTMCEKTGKGLGTEITPHLPCTNVSPCPENCRSQETTVYQTSDYCKDFQVRKEPNCVKIKEEPSLDPGYMIATEPQIQHQSYDGTMELALDGSPGQFGKICNFSGSEGRLLSNTHPECKTFDTETNHDSDSYLADKLVLDSFVKDSQEKNASCDAESYLADKLGLDSFVQDSQEKNASSDAESYLDSSECKNWKKLRTSDQTNDPVVSHNERRMNNYLTCSGTATAEEIKVEYNYSNKLEHVTDNRDTVGNGNFENSVKKRKLEMTLDGICTSEEYFSQIPLIGIKQEKDNE